MTEVLVVGGGVTGLGVARDLAMRGVSATLAERGSLAAGTSGHTHGLLHSGARYADDDPASARACIAENRTLREMAPDCVRDTGGVFAALASTDYVAEKRAACEACGVPVETLSGDEVREVEPALAEGVTQALRVPDAVVDPFRLCVATATDAEERGATVRTNTAVTDLTVERGAVVGATLDGERIEVDHVVNAAGAWADRVAGLAGASVPVRTTKGAMAVVDHPHRGVVNRCRPRSQGDIAVPVGERTILGTTDADVEDPDEFPREEREVALLREELAALLPGVADAALVRAYWGVRPLFDARGSTDETDVTREFGLLDHREGGVAGLTSVVGGKLTTHRRMAEAVADHVCERLGVDGACRTAETPLSEVGNEEYERFGLDPGVDLVRGR